MIGLLLSINFGLFQSLTVVLNYLVNYEYYSEVLCVNKDVEDSCCHGKCAMEKELVSKEQDENIPQLPQWIKHKLSESLPVHFSRLSLPSFPVKFISFYFSDLPVLYLEKDERPPCLNV